MSDCYLLGDLFNFAMTFIYRYARFAFVCVCHLTYAALQWRSFADLPVIGWYACATFIPASARKMFFVIFRNIETLKRK